MEELAQITRERFDARSVASVIFAPQPQNINAIAVTGGWYGLEPTQFPLSHGVPKHLEQTLSEAISESIREGIVVVSTVLADRYPFFFEANASSATVSIGAVKSQGVPARSFPFVRHLDLFTSPIEGLIFDTNENS